MRRNTSPKMSLQSDFLLLHLLWHQSLLRKLPGKAIRQVHQLRHSCQVCCADKDVDRRVMSDKNHEEILDIKKPPLSGNHVFL